jgi:signal peptidase I
MNMEMSARSATGCRLVADMVRSFGKVRVKVTGSSMIPAIWPGDVVVVQRCEAAELQVGQVILYTRAGELVAHRIAAICGDSVITRGDTLSSNDPLVGKSEIVGEVLYLVRDGRRVQLNQSSMFSEVLRRSDFCMRMTLHLHYGLWRLCQGLRRAADREVRWAC